jgi:hypothetical protein
VADVDLDLLDEQRVNGSVIPLQDMIKDAYDSVVHFSDYKSQKPTEGDLTEVFIGGQTRDTETRKSPEHEGAGIDAAAELRGVPAD